MSTGTYGRSNMPQVPSHSADFSLQEFFISRKRITRSTGTGDEYTHTVKPLPLCPAAAGLNVSCVLLYCIIITPSRSDFSNRGLLAGFGEFSFLQIKV
ncbi:hypothetical protein Baya_13253 [Bagarius yarrelli]|uniref:Uncharacterized protein n=1 Tax=Bagarius yarrelli TaxID=175774 RepID=A0A556V569_BAGYA|nr:hypothetical protein Baya_13253 [Bagarius yarrelli]